MTDSEIVELYWTRSEEAIAKTKEKYGRYCSSIAYRILASFEDSEECVSDVYLSVWYSIPPKRPEDMKSYLGKITRNKALDRVRANSAKKRGELPLVLEELEIDSLDTVENELDKKLLADAISRFLHTLSAEKRTVFLLRYWNFESISEISLKTGWNKNRVKVTLYRLRKQLFTYLEKEGFLL